MTKYIDAEKLRKLLTNRYEEITVPVLTDEGGLESFYRRSEIHNILKIVESLQQEQPSLPDNLDEAELKYVESLDNPPTNQEEERIIYQTFKAGAEWMAKQIK
jgi:hypothetical protein